MGILSKIALTVGAGLGVAGLLMLAHSASQERMPDTFVVGLVAVGDGDRAVVLLRHNESGKRSRSWAALVDGGGKTRWTTELPGATLGKTRINEGVTVTADTVTVSSADPRRSVVALSLDEGTERWRSPSVPAETYIGDVGDSQQVFQIYLRKPVDSYLRALDRNTGVVQWERAVDFSQWTWVRLTDHAVWFAPYDNAVRSISRSNGKGLTEDIGVGCLAGGRIWILAQSEQGGWELRVRPLSGDEPARVWPIHWNPEMMRPDRAICGIFGGQFVFGYRSDSATGIAGVDPVKGELAWKIDLDGYGPQGLHFMVQRDSLPYHGELPRHLWFPARNLDSKTIVVHVDLETRTLVHRSPPLDSRPLIPSFTSHGVTYIILNEKRLIAFDGAELSAAITLPDDSVVHPLQAGRRRLWLYRPLSLSPFDRQGLAALDSKTLTPVFVRGNLEIANATAETKKLLGL